MTVVNRRKAIGSLPTVVAAVLSLSLDWNSHSVLSLSLDWNSGTTWQTIAHIAIFALYIYIYITTEIN